MPRTTGIISAISCGFRPASTSSSSSSRGRVASARASSSRLRPATVRSAAGLSSCGARPTRCGHALGLGQRRGATRRRAGARRRRCSRAPSARRRAARSGRCASCRRAHSGAARWPVMSRPSKTHAAARRASGSPTSARTAWSCRRRWDRSARRACRGGTARLTSCTARRPPKAIDRPRTSSSASAIAALRRHSARTERPSPAMPRGMNITISTSTDAVDHHVDAGQLRRTGCA